MPVGIRRLRRAIVRTRRTIQCRWPAGSPVERCKSRAGARGLELIGWLEGWRAVPRELVPGGDPQRVGQRLTVRRSPGWILEELRLFHRMRSVVETPWRRARDHRVSPLRTVTVAGAGAVLVVLWPAELATRVV